MNVNEYAEAMQAVFEELEADPQRHYGDMQAAFEKEYAANPEQMAAALESMAAQLWNGTYVPGKPRMELYARLGCKPEPANLETRRMAAQLRAASNVIMVSLREPAGLGLE